MNSPLSPPSPSKNNNFYLSRSFLRPFRSTHIQARMSSPVPSPPPAHEAPVVHSRLVRVVTSRGPRLVRHSIRGVINAIFRRVVRTVTHNSEIRLHNFKTFSIGGHSTQRNHGPHANRSIGISRGRIPFFGANGLLHSQLGSN